MGDDRELRFYRLYEKLASATQIVNKEFDVKNIENILNEISAMYRLSKGVTHFYKNPVEEAQGIGETMCSYDIGAKEEYPVHTIRFVTRLMSITTMTVYMAKDEQPLTEDELSKVDLTMRTALAFISRNRLQVIAEELAFYDDMGFCNIRRFFHFLTWNGQPRALEGMVAMEYDLRHFSLVNEQYGRDAGDFVLRAHYKIIEETIGKNGIVARLGGDAFVCIFEKALLQNVIKILTETAVPYNDKGDTLTVFACAGIFIIPEGFELRSPGDIMNKVMHSYNIAKNGEQGQFIYYNAELLIDREKSKRILQQFPAALKNNEFKVFYQPKVNIITGEICGGEALSRWFKNGKIVPPIEFIPSLEESSDICKLDFHVLEQVCINIRKWLDEGRKAVRISVNLSRRHMVNERLLETIIEIVDRYEIPHSLIEIELTETTTDVEFKDLQRIVCGLQEQNICTSVDDFGMGFSSLNLIRVIPWNVLKVDRTFLPLDEEKNTDIRSIMFKHVVAMTKEMGLECIVEGVETPAQLMRLKENKCEQAQGFLFDRPLPPEEFEKRLDIGHYSMDF